MNLLNNFYLIYGGTPVALNNIKKEILFILFRHYLNNKTSEIEIMQQFNIQLNTSKFLKSSGKAKGLCSAENSDSFFSDELKNVIKGLVKKARFNLDQVGEVNKEMNLSGPEFKNVKSMGVKGEQSRELSFSLDGFAGNNTRDSAILKKEVSLKSLDTGENSDEDDCVLAESVLPYIESMLNLFGLNHQQVKDILTDIKTENQEISLSKLIKNLKEVMPESEQFSDLLIKKGSFGELKSLLQGVDMDVPLKGKSTFSLEEFVKELEKKNGFAGNNSMESGVLGREVKGKVNDTTGLFDVLNEASSKKKELKTGQHDKADNKNMLGKEKFLSKHDNKENKETVKNSIEPIAWHDKTDNKNMRGKEGFLLKHDNKENKETVKNSDVKNIKESEDFNKFIKKTDDTEVVKNDSNLKTVLEENTASGIKGKSMASVPGKTDEKPMPSYLLNQVTKQILRSVKEGGKEVAFTIKPPSLGRVRLGFEKSINGLKVSILAENKVTKDLLLSNVADLKTALLEMGVKLEKVEVLFAGNFNQFSANLKQDNNRKFTKNREQKIDGKQKQQNSQEVNKKHIYAKKIGEGSLDLVA